MRYVRMGVVLSVCLLFLGYTYRVLFFARAVSVTYDDMFSDHYCAFLAEQCTVDAVNHPHSFAHSLYTQYSSIASLSIAFLPHYTAQVTINALRPVLRVNDTHVITETYSVLPADIYKQHYRETVSRIHIDDAKTVSAFTAARMCACLAHLPETVVQDYEIVWRDETDVWLYHKHEKAIALRIHADCVIDQQEIMHGCQILHTVQERDIRTKKKGILWVADMRFEKQIVAYTR
jgi:hypothetical protein